MSEANDSAVLLALFVIWGVFSPKSLDQLGEQSLGWMIATLVESKEAPFFCAV